MNLHCTKEDEIYKREKLKLELGSEKKRIGNNPNHSSQTCFNTCLLNYVNTIFVVI